MDIIIPRPSGLSLHFLSPRAVASKKEGRVMPKPSHAKQFLAKEQMGELIAALQKDGYTVLGPSLVGGVISLRPIRSAEDLARGVEDIQQPGSYRTAEGDRDFYFRNTPGPDGPKRFFFPPTQTLFGLHVDGRRFVLDAGPPEPPKLALLGVRPCELAAIGVLGPRASGRTTRARSAARRTPTTPRRAEAR